MEQMIEKRRPNTAANRTSLRKAAPTLEDATWSENLTSMSVDYVQSQDDFCHTLTPILPVDTPQGKYKVFSRADAFRTEARRRRPGAAAAVRSTAISERTYSAECTSLATKLADEERSAKDSVIDERRKTLEVTRDLLITRELDWKSAYFAASIWDNDLAGTTNFVKWSNASATIIADVRTFKDLIHVKTAADANRMAISNDVYATIINDSEILDRIPSVVSTSTDDPRAIVKANIKALQVLFEIEEIRVARASRNSAAEGITASHAYMMSDALLIMACPSNGPALDVPSASYCASWSPFDNVSADVANAGAAAISSWYEDKEKSQYFQGDMYYDFLIPDTSAGLYAGDVI